MKKPEFEQFRQSSLRKFKALPQQQREPYRQAVVDLLEDSGLFLVQKARKDGHNDALIEIHAGWIGTDFSPDHVKDALKEIWPGDVFGPGEKKHWIESEDEVVTLQFAWVNEANLFVTGLIKVVV